MKNEYALLRRGRRELDIKKVLRNLKVFVSGL